jgi:ribonucleoside-diphosphate reductase alpha chain
MGFSHFLALIGIRYGDVASIEMAKRVGSLIFVAARRESERLGKVRGHFSAWHSGLGLSPRRNAALVAISGTSTTSLLVGTTGGIEPIFAYVTKQTVMGKTLILLDPILEFFGRTVGLHRDQLIRRLSNGESLSRVLGGGVAHVLPLAHDIVGDSHIEVQAAFQNQIDGGISKTLNCAGETTIDQVTQWLTLAYQRGCMGLTIYRDGTRTDQPLSHVARTV